MAKVKKLMEFDNCVQCDKPTSYKKTDHIDTRNGYIEGFGQLCIECHLHHIKIHKKDSVCDLIDDNFWLG